MSWNPSLDPKCPEAGSLESVETLVVPRARDLGGFEVRRALPAPRRQMVGPFIFFDQIGPAEFLAGKGIDVRPHPHIGLGTVTYLYQGALRHRDSLGSDLSIRPGAVNWMVAGRGITHSERTDPEKCAIPHNLFGIQTWLALPDEAEDVEPLFEHHPKDTLPELDYEGVWMRLILGSAYGERSPVSLYSETFYGDVTMEAGASLPMPDDHEDRGLYVVQGSVVIAGETFEENRMMIFRPGDRITVKAGPEGTRFMILGGATLSGPRYIWWNFVASSVERIDAAKAEWQAGQWGEGRFSLPPNDAEEFIPLPDDVANARPRRADLR